MKKLLLFIAILISSVGLFAQSVGDNTIIDYEGYSLKFTVTSVEPAECEVLCSTKPTSSTEIVIPSSVTIEGMEFSVTSIGGWAFEYCSNLTSIEIPNSVTSIGSSAFRGCSNLTSIEIPNSVTSIGDSAFSYCSKLTSIEIPNSVTSIYPNTFLGCYNLTSIEIPNSITYIGHNAFSGCDSLTSIEIPNSVTSIAYEVFSNCDNLTSITVEEGNTVYDSRNDCNAIIETESNTLIAGCQNTIIPNSVTSIGNDAFSGCTSLTSIEIPNSVTSIGSFAFFGCDNLTSIEIPNGVISIGNGAFYACDNLTSIMLSNSVTSIKERAFDMCISLTSIEIPNSVTSIGNYAFKECTSLTSITVEEGNSVYDSRNNCNAIIETETNTLIAGCQNTTIPNSISSIGGGAFSSCENLTSIEIPNSVTSIGSYAFSWCTSLTSIEIPNSVTSIGNNAFCGCDNLTSIEIPNSVTSIGFEAFYGCSKLTSVYCYAGNVIVASDDIFFNCPSDMIIYVPAQSVDAYKAVSPWNNYTIEAMEEPQFATEFFYDFNDGSLEGWRTIDADNDGYEWGISNSVIYGGVDGTHGLYSLCYEYDFLYPDNYIVTDDKYLITGSSVFSFVHLQKDGYYYKENLGVVVSENGIDWELIWNERYEKSYSEWQEESISLSMYAGKTIYIGFRHYDCNGNDADGIKVDNVKLEVTGNENLQSNYWKPNESLYANNMSLIGLVQIDGVDQNKTLLEVGAFCGEEVRGSRLVQYVPALDKYLVFLTIHGEADDEITFKLYDHAKSELLDLRSPDTVKFTVNGMLGSVIDPYILNFNNIVEITATVNPAEAGTVTGTGIYAVNDNAILTATPNEGYTFVSWKENGSVVSTNAEYSFTVSKARLLVANFELLTYEITATSNPTEAGEISGTGIYTHGDVATLTATANEGFTFKNWSINGNVVSMDEEYSFTVTEAVELVANYNYVQTRDLKFGWSWFSSFIEMSGEAGLEMLENALGEFGLQIKNHTEFVVYSDGGWYGSLMAANVYDMFMIETSEACQMELIGDIVNPETTPVTVGTNWRWISYLVNTSFPVEEALGTVVPHTGDYIKSKTAFSQYYEGAGWLGALNTMNPGEGYMYYNTSGTAKTLVYPSAPTTRSMKANVTAENNYWIPEAGKYATNMSVIAVVENNGIEMSDYEVAAFVGDEVRGSARPIYIEALDRYMVFMTVYGNSNERIEFKYYDMNADAVESVTSREDIVFADNAIYGSVDNAIVLTCGTLGINENASEVLNVYPNPANVNAEISLGMTYDRVEVYNAIGVKVAEYADVNRINGIETAGVYVIKVMNDDVTKNCRIVIR